MSSRTQLWKQRPNLTQVEQLCRLNWTQKDEGNSISQSKWSHYIVYFLKQRKYKVWQWNDHAWEISCFKLLYNSILSPVWVGLSLVESASTWILVKPGIFLKISSYYSLQKILASMKFAHRFANPEFAEALYWDTHIKICWGNKRKLLLLREINYSFLKSVSCEKCIGAAAVMNQGIRVNKYCLSRVDLLMIIWGEISQKWPSLSVRWACRLFSLSVISSLKGWEVWLSCSFKTTFY